MRLKQAVDTVRAAEPNVVLLDAGDEFQGTLFYTQFKGDVAAEVLDALDYTAFTPGNHESMTAAANSGVSWSGRMCPYWPPT